MKESKDNESAKKAETLVNSPCDKRCDDMYSTRYVSSVGADETGESGYFFLVSPAICNFCQCVQRHKRELKVCKAHLDPQGVQGGDPTF